MALKYPCQKCGQPVYTTFNIGSRVECRGCGISGDVPDSALEVPLPEAISYFAKVKEVQSNGRMEVESITSFSLYNEAYNIQYSEHDLKKASVLYDRIIAEFPLSDEAEFAKIQKNRIEPDIRLLQQMDKSQPLIIRASAAGEKAFVDSMKKHQEEMPYKLFMGGAIFFICIGGLIGLSSWNQPNNLETVFQRGPLSFSQSNGSAVAMWICLVIGFIMFFVALFTKNE